MSVPNVPVRFTLCAALAVTLALAGCAGSSSTPAGQASSNGSTVSAPESKVIDVVTSTDVYADIAQTIGGDEVKVTSFISDPDQDPHSYEASAQNQLAVSKADIVIENGGGYDDFIDRMVKASNPEVPVLNVVDISGRKAAAGQELNEHVWYDFPTVSLLTDKLVAALSAVDDKEASAFQANAEAFKSEVQALITEEGDLKASYAGKGVAITEPVPLYVLDAVGLVNETPPAFSEAIEEGDDVSASVLKQTLDLFSGGKVVALVYNEQTSGPITEQAMKAAEKAGVPVVPVTETLPEGKSYIAWMTENLDNLKQALSTG